MHVWMSPHPLVGPTYDVRNCANRAICSLTYLINSLRFLLQFTAHATEVQVVAFLVVAFLQLFCLPPRPISCELNSVSMYDSTGSS